MALIVILFLFICSYFIYTKIQDKKLLETVTTSRRGTKTERDLTLKLLKSGIPSQAIFHDLYLEKYTGNYSQIDLVAITQVGIIVFEIKRYSGWIFGKGYQPQWTQVLAYGKQKYQFYNPVMQNNGHVSDLRKKLNQEDIPFFSVIVFYGDCVLRDVSAIPNTTILTKSNAALNVVKDIIKLNDTVEFRNYAKIIAVLDEAVRNGESPDIKLQHSENIRTLLNMRT
ncbi:MAG: NERD domain-containing protein [Chryseobacterium sp.]|nr:MAG: NERD domain-containing protein [Chryseobacterium sp.]